MARAGKENQCGFSVLPAATLLENGKLGDRQLHIFYNAPLFAPKFCISIVFSFSWESCNTQKKLETKFV